MTGLLVGRGRSEEGATRGIVGLGRCLFAGASLRSPTERRRTSKAPRMLGANRPPAPQAARGPQGAVIDAATL